MWIEYCLFSDNTYSIHFNKNNINIGWFYSDENIINHWDDYKNNYSIMINYLNELGIKPSKYYENN